MKLEELLSVLSDNATVVITDAGKEIARYDGRDSIPTELNTKEIILVYPLKNGQLFVEVL